MEEILGLWNKILTDLEPQMPEFIANERYKNNVHVQETQSHRQSHRQIDKWGEYTSPKEILTDTQLEELRKRIRAVESKMVVSDTIEVHHPFYRHSLRDYAIKLGCSVVSKSNNQFDHHEDSDLYHHYECGNSSLSCKINWHADIGTCGQMLGSYYICPDCGEHVLSDYIDDKNDPFGYKLCRGKNCITITKQKE